MENSTADKPIYIDFGVAKYALADVCESLYKSGVHNGFLTKEDGDIHVRWKYKLTRERNEIIRSCSGSQTNEAQLSEEHE